MRDRLEERVLHVVQRDEPGLRGPLPFQRFDQRLRAHLEKASEGVPGTMYVTLMPTLQCNLACSYCFQKEHPAFTKMSSPTEDATLEWLLRRVDERGLQRLEERVELCALAGKDVLACAMTGSGKTAAFVLPILHRLMGKKRGVTRALIITPTRELAAQVARGEVKFVVVFIAWALALYVVTMPIWYDAVAAPQTKSGGNGLAP